MKYISSVFVLCISQLFYAQDYINFRAITIENGLSNGDITGITQDINGYIWIGTYDGLNRFDGYTFKIFRSDRGDTAAIPSSTIRTLYYSKNNTLWIGTDRGICKYDVKQENFHVYKDVIGDSVVYDIAEDKDGNIWIATAFHGIYKLNILTNKIEHIDIYFRDHSPVLIANKIIVDSKGILWIGTNKGLIRYDTRLKTTKIYDDFGKFKKNPELLDNYISSICELNDSVFLAGSWNLGLFLIDENSELVEPLFTGENYRQIRAVYKATGDNIFIGTVSGYAILNSKTKSVELFDKNFQKSSYPMMPAAVNAIYIDFDKNLWLGHEKQGISFSVKQKPFKILNSDRGNTLRLSNNEVTAVLKDSKDQIWVGYWSGNVDIVDTKSGKVQHISTKDAYNITYSGTIFSFLESKNGEIWCSSYRGGLQRYNLSTGNFDVVLKNTTGQSGLASNDIRKIFEDDNGNFWLSLQGEGIIKYNHETGRIDKFYYNPQTAFTISCNWTFDIAYDKNNCFWFGTSYGLTMYNRSTEKFARFYSNIESDSSLASNVINSILCDSKGNVWIGTDDGLSLYNSSDSTFMNFTINDGLPNNNIQGILEDIEGNLWISTSNGLCRYNISENKFKNYYLRHGISDNNFLTRSCFSSKDGELFFGSKSGLTYFNPADIHDDTTSPKILINDILVLNQSIIPGRKYNSRIILENPVYNSKKLTLTNKEKIITISFVALNYSATENTKYAYRLSGRDDKKVPWNYIGQRRYVTYTDLPPGSYVFEVIATNNDDVWSSLPAKLEIEIIPPFWDTLIFKILVFLLLIFSIYLIFHLRYVYIKNQKVELEKKVKERTSQLYDANTQLIERQKEIENKSIELVDQTRRLQEANQLLEVQKLELKDLNATKDKFFSIIAHDLKAPFNSILGFGELLSKRFDSLEQAKIKLFVDSIFTSSQKVYELLENLLQWSRAQTNSLIINKVEVRLRDVVKSVFYLLEDNAENKEIKLITNINENIIVFADENILKTVLLNLVSNAIKFTDKGIIEINCLEKESDYVITVTDTGRGMEKSVIGKLFRIDKSMSTVGTRGEEGTGLGLIICKEFVEKNNGKIWVESTPNKGTTFYFTVPK